MNGRRYGTYWYTKSIQSTSSGEDDEGKMRVHTHKHIYIPSPHPSGCLSRNLLKSFVGISIMNVLCVSMHVCIVSLFNSITIEWWGYSIVLTPIGGFTDCLGTPQINRGPLRDEGACPNTPSLISSCCSQGFKLLSWLSYTSMCTSRKANVRSMIKCGRSMLDVL